jgi:hypothetical protein
MLKVSEIRFDKSSILDAYWFFSGKTVFHTKHPCLENTVWEKLPSKAACRLLTQTNPLKRWDSRHHRSERIALSSGEKLL